MNYLKQKILHIGIMFMAIIILFAVTVFYLLLASIIGGSTAFFIVVIVATFMLIILYYFFIKPIRELGKVLAEFKFLCDQHYYMKKQQNKTIPNSLSELLGKYRDAVENEHVETILRQEAEYAELQSQINPHFLYNTLEMIRSEAIVAEHHVISDMTEALAKYFRYSIGKDTNRVHLKEEIENINNYMKIQQYRFEDKFEFNVYSREKAEVYNAHIIPKMILQPLVENAIFHGIEGKIGRGRVTLHIDLTDNKIYLTISDDGVGMTGDRLNELRQKLAEPERKVQTEKNTTHNGIALPNINRRLKLLFGEEYGLQINSVCGIGTKMMICIPRNIEECD